MKEDNYGVSGLAYKRMISDGRKVEKEWFPCFFFGVGGVGLIDALR